MPNDIKNNKNATLERKGDDQVIKKNPNAALAFYHEATAGSERPSARLMIKLAHAALDADDATAAARWCKRVVDSSGGYAEWASAAALLQKCPPEALETRRSGLRLAIVSTWTTKTFAPLLRLAAARCGLHIEIWEAEYGQYFNETLQHGSTLFAQRPDVIVLLPDDRALSFALHNEPDQMTVNSELARWTAVWDSVRAKSQATLIQLGTALRPGDPFGNFGSGFGGSITSQGARLNTSLAEAANSNDIAFVDVERLSARHGKTNWFDDRSWYLAKIPYSPNALCRLAHETAVVLAARAGMSRRCLVLDLDNTLWGGVIGDDGLEGIRLGDDVRGEAFVDFQHALKALTQRGVLLAVCSKNEASVARAPFERHPEMVLGLDDITAFVANWRPKSENIRKISCDLDLGLESMTFFDDNPYEREEVRRHLPQLDVPILPDDPTLYRAALEAYPYFEPGSFTAADATRGEQYRARAQANALRNSTSSFEDYQKSLDMVAQIGLIDNLNMPRVVQLINKTNQFNLTTRRRNRAELEEFITKPNHCHFWVRLSDRFADHGLIAVVLGTVAEKALEIDTFLMSCRVIGRGIEQIIAHELASIALKQDLQMIRGIYIPTERNNIVSDLYPRLGFKLANEEVEGVFEINSTDVHCDVPIRVEYIS